MSDSPSAEFDARLARIRRAANAAMAGVDPRHRPDREDAFLVADVLWLLDQVDHAPCEGCLCVSEHDGDYGSSGHAGPCPPCTCGGTDG